MTTETVPYEGTEEDLAPVVGVDEDPGLRSLPLSPFALASVLVGVLLPVTDFFIVNVALPTMARQLHATSSSLELVVSGYATAYAVLLILGGRLGDAFGRKRLFLIGMASFTVASLLCGLAPTIGVLIGARLLQGAVAALMVPQVLSTIQSTGDSVSRAKAISWFGASAGLGAVIGQVVGGVLVSANVAGWGWRPIFLVNVPVGIIGLAVAARFLPETRAGRRPDFDVSGMGLLAVALTSLLIPLTEGRALGWPWWSWVLLAVSAASARAFVRVERRKELRGGDPLVPPSVVAHHTMRRGIALSGPFFASFAAFMFVYALVTQGQLGFSAESAGVALAPLAVVFLIASLSIPRLVARFGHNVIAAGASVQIVGLLLLAGTVLAAWPHIHPLELWPAFTVVGAGQGLMMPSFIRVILSEVPVEMAGAGSGVYTTAQQVMLALGVATLGSLFVSLEPAGRLGAEHALLLLFATQVAIAAVIVSRAKTLLRSTH
jgi:MFS family permease